MNDVSVTSHSIACFQFKDKKAKTLTLITDCHRLIFEFGGAVKTIFWLMIFPNSRLLNAR